MTMPIGPYYDDSVFSYGENGLTCTLGETNTASNVGGYEEIYKQKVGVDLELRTLKEGTGIDLIWYEEGAGYALKFEQTAGTSEYNAIIRTGDEDSRAIVYTPSSSFNLKKLSLYIKKTGTPTEDFDINVYLADESHLPTGDSLGSAAIDASGVGTEYAYEDFIFASPVSLISETEYVITFTSSAATPNYYYAARYTVAGYTCLYYTSGTWIVDTAGRYFKVKLYSPETTYYDYIEVVVEPSEIKLDDLGTPDDNTDLNASTSKHGLMPKLPFSGDLLSTTTVAFNADADTTLYTVPTGKRCVLSHAIAVAAGDAGATTTVSIGANGTETDFIPANTLENLDAEYDAVILQPIPNTTPLKIKSYAATTVIEAQVASQSGVAGNTIYLFGILY